jgi:hypothetical protein
MNYSGAALQSPVLLRICIGKHISAPGFLAFGPMGLLLGGSSVFCRVDTCGLRAVKCGNECYWVSTRMVNGLVWHCSFILV